MTKSINRKEFIRLSTAAALSLPVWSMISCKSPDSQNSEESALPAEMADPTYASHPGLQLYTVRDLFAQDPEGTLKQLADLGIKQLEFYDATALKNYVPKVKDLGMEVISTHFSPGLITGNWGDPANGGMTPPENYSFERMIEECAASGVRYAGIAYIFPGIAPPWIISNTSPKKPMRPEKRAKLQVFNCIITIIPSSSSRRMAPRHLKK